MTSLLSFFLVLLWSNVFESTGRDTPCKLLRRAGGPTVAQAIVYTSSKRNKACVIDTDPHGLILRLMYDSMPFSSAGSTSFLMKDLW